MENDTVREGPGHLARIVIAPDKFRSSATAAQLRSVISGVVAELGFEPVPVPISDGGEGLLEVFGGVVHHSTVTGPIGDPVLAEWRMRVGPDGRATAIIEMARASGLALITGESSNDPMRASTLGTGELVKRAVDCGATTIIVGCGGSASTDGGAGALEILDAIFPRDDITLKVACDVTTTFLEAPSVFGPQKGATPVEVRLLRARLEGLAELYRSRYGVEVNTVARSGAAGGLAGGLYAIGAELYSGIDLVADELQLDELIRSSALVITGEGRFDATSLAGKAVGALLDRTRSVTRLLIVTGEASIALDARRDPHATLIDLAERFGMQRSYAATLECVESVVREALASYAP